MCIGTETLNDNFLKIVRVDPCQIKGLFDILQVLVHIHSGGADHRNVRWLINKYSDMVS